MKVCPYNATHVHSAAEHQYHLFHCPDRNLIDREIVFGMKVQMFMPAVCLLPSLLMFEVVVEFNFTDSELLM